MLCIIDIDGTLADPTARFEKAGKEPDVKNPEVYQRWLDVLQAPGALLEDRPIRQVVDTVRALADKNEYGEPPVHEFIYLTGRSENYREETQTWLDKHDLPKGRLLMRRADEYNSPVEYKQKAMQAIRLFNPTQKILVLDDDSAGDCSKMYLELGAVHLKVVGR